MAAAASCAVPLPPWIYRFTCSQPPQSPSRAKARTPLRSTSCLKTSSFNRWNSAFPWVASPSAMILASSGTVMLSTGSAYAANAVGSTLSPVPKPPKRINTSAAKAIAPHKPHRIYLILNFLAFFFITVSFPLFHQSFLPPLLRSLYLLQYFFRRGMEQLRQHQQVGCTRLRCTRLPF